MFNGTGMSDLPEAWGSSLERLRLGIDVEDEEGPRLRVDYLPNGRVTSGSVSLDHEESADFAMAVLRLTSYARGCTTVELLADLLDAERSR